VVSFQLLIGLIQGFVEDDTFTSGESDNLFDGLEDLENTDLFDPTSISLEGLGLEDFSFLIDEPI